MTDIKVPRELLAELTRTPQDGEIVSKSRMDAIVVVGHLAESPAHPAQSDLAERLEAFIPDGDGYNSEYAHTLVEAVEALRAAQPAQR